MADSKKPREPQSYGSDKDWLTGKTGQTVENTPDRVSRHDEEFYESRHDSSESAAKEGGQQSPKRDDLLNTAAPDEATTEVIDRASTSVSQTTERESFFKKRDY